MLIFERFEGEFAVIENDGEILKMDRLKLSDSVKEGDVLKKIDDMYFSDKEETAKRREKILKLQNSLWG